MLSDGTTSYKKRVSYYYPPLIGDFTYGVSHPMKPHRVRMTHDLLQCFDLLQQLDVVEHLPIDSEDLTRFHADDYIDFLRDISPCNVSEFSDQLMRFNVGDDCPVLEGLYDYVCLYSAGSVGGARLLNDGRSDISLNWSGGLHHGKRHEASGFCYVNDCVLGILELLKHHARVLYIDIDIHHGDGVEEAFYTTDRVMTLSFHKYGDYFPGTGALNDVGVGRGLGYSVNVPLHDGMNDESFIDLFSRVTTVIRERFQPSAVVLQCGADSLSGDRLGCFNLSLKGHGRAVEIIRDWNVPLLMLGGGGYTLRNVSKCWSHETALALRTSLPSDLIPTTSKFRNYFGPDFSMTVRTSNMENSNSQRAIDFIIQSITENLRNRVFPTSPSLELNRTFAKEQYLTDKRGNYVDDNENEYADDQQSFDTSRQNKTVGTHINQEDLTMNDLQEAPTNQH